MSKFSIIITFSIQNDYLLENLHHINQQTFNDFEVILISENQISLDTSKYNFTLKILKSIQIFPGIKRHEAAKKANSEYLCFIDDDAYPNPNWLKDLNAEILENNYSCIGGPAIDIFSEKNIGSLFSFTYKCKYIGGFPERYLQLYPKREVEDWPSVNLTIKKSLYDKSSGFNHKIWPGEDTLLCNELNEKLNSKINYIPHIYVNHHRRTTFKKHVKQIIGYAKTRGVFFMSKIKNSRNIKFAIPSIFLVYITSITVFLIIKPNIVFEYSKLIFFPLILYFMINLIATMLSNYQQKNNFFYNFVHIGVNFINHILYGFGFLKGVLRYAFNNNHYKK